MTKDLSVGFTENRVTKVGGLVVKTGFNVKDEAYWYDHYKDKADIPFIIGVKDEDLVMKYVDRDGEFSIDEVVKVVEKYRHYEPISTVQWTGYIDRIFRHLTTNLGINNGGRLLEKMHQMIIPHTFCHGDLSVYNIIPTSSGLKLIDPLYSKDKFGSYLLDYAKLLFSLKFYQGDVGSFNELYKKIDIFFMDVLIAAECVRVASYKKQFNFIAENLINEL
jgi:hypothetical protein